MGDLILLIIFGFLGVIVLGVGKTFWDGPGTGNKAIAVVVWVVGFMLVSWITSI
jgi:hypothetical protein